ncbi:MAG: hypothetical protein H6704_01110 [Myxococcales bacterium]|nr:hypothetical protein [Myxococcales bacterium]MCB9528970.1 hypothetical protein [Myxococcales bacterium]MCB9534842.1 hypothetical protein [Myxococcales bacterium]
MADERTPAAPTGGGADIMRMFEGPGEEALEQDQRLLVAATRNAFRELEKLVKNIGLYGAAHKSIDRFRERLFVALTEVLELAPEVEVVLGPYEFTLFDQVIYENPNVERNFIYKFYMDGIRRITFSAGLTYEEINDFVDVLLTDWDDPSLFEDDAVTMLWGKELPHVHYVVIDSFADDTAEDEQHAYTVEGVIERVRTGADSEALQAQSTGGGAGGGRRSRRSIGQIAPVVRLSEVDLDRFEEAPFAMDEAEFLTLKSVIHTTDRETLEKFIEILFKVNLAEAVSTADRQGRIVNLFDRIADLLLSQGRIGDLERLLRKVRRLTGPGGTVIEENLAAIERIFDHWTHAEFVDRVMQGLSDPEFPYTASALAIAGLLNAGAVPHLAMAAGHVTIPERRQALFDLVGRRLAGQERAVAQLLRTVEAAHAHDLVRILRPVCVGDDLTAAVRYAMGSPHEAVRLEGLSLMPHDEAPRHLDLLYKALKDPGRTVRGKALHLLTRVGGPDVHAHIMGCIREREFGSYTLDEKRRYFAAAALTGDARAFFLETFHQGGLFGKGNDAVRHCAAVALGIRLHRDAVPLFEKEIKRRLKHELVADACAWALQHMSCDREERTRQLYDIFFQGELRFAPPDHVGTP